MARGSFGVTDGTFLFWFVFSLGGQRKNEQVSSLAKQITKIINDKIQYNPQYSPQHPYINFMNPQKNNQFPY
jgi:hypothetical protein